MDSKITVLLISFVTLWTPTSTGQSPEKRAATLSKVQLTTGTVIFAEVLDASESELKLLDLRTGNRVIVLRRDIRKWDNNVSDKEAVAAVGLPSLVAWRIKSLGGSSKSGRIAKVATPLIYVSLGSKHNIRQGQKLEVFRDEGELLDPDQGKSLGRALARIARLEVVETKEDFSKAKLLGDLDVELREGDSVEPASTSGLMAILPLVDVNGKENDGGKQLAEELTTVLVRQEIPVVERSRLEQVLQELNLQKTKLVDPSTTQEVGKQIGAYAVLTGTILMKKPATEAHVRLIEVETGKVLVTAAGRTTVIESIPGRKKNQQEPEIANRTKNDPMRIGSVWKGRISQEVRGEKNLVERAMVLTVMDRTGSSFTATLNFNNGDSAYTVDGSFKNGDVTWNTNNAKVLSGKVGLNEYAGRISGNKMELKVKGTNHVGKFTWGDATLQRVDDD